MDKSYEAQKYRENLLKSTYATEDSIQRALDGYEKARKLKKESPAITEATLACFEIFREHVNQKGFESGFLLTVFSNLYGLLGGISLSPEHKVMLAGTVEVVSEHLMHLALSQDILQTLTGLNQPPSPSHTN